MKHLAAYTSIQRLIPAAFSTFFAPQPRALNSSFHCLTLFCFSPFRMYIADLSFDDFLFRSASHCSISDSLPSSFVSPFI